MSEKIGRRKKRKGKRRKKKRFFPKKKSVEDLALQRMEYLFSLAKSVFKVEPNLAKRYVQIGLKVGMKARVRVPVYWRRQICRNCKSFLVPGINLRIRLRSGPRPHVTYTCMECGEKKRFHT